MPWDGLGMAWDASGSLGCWELARSGKEGGVGGVLTLTHVVVLSWS